MQNIYISDCVNMQGLEKIKGCEKVILQHFPLSPNSKRAVNLLINECEKLKEDEEKLYCYETLRSTLIQLKSFYQPYTAIIEELNIKIAHLRVIQKIKFQYNRYSIFDYERLYKNELSLLKYQSPSSVFWFLIVVISLLGWIGTLVFTILFGFRENIKIKFIVYCTASFIFFFSLWLLGLYLA